MGKAIFFLENKKRKKEIKTKEKIIINEKFEDMEEINENIYVGIGIKKMKGYKCTLKIDELNKLREHFCEIKTNTNNSNWIIWKTIKRAVAYDELRASLLLEEYKIKTVNGCINHLIDSKGNHYYIPNYCINDPYYEKTVLNEKNVEEKKIKMKFYGEKNIEMEIGNKLRGKELKSEIKIKEKIEDDKIIRLFYRGREIKDDDFLYNHNLNENCQIMLMVQ